MARRNPDDELRKRLQLRKLLKDRAAATAPDIPTPPLSTLTPSREQMERFQIRPDAADVPMPDLSRGARLARQIEAAGRTPIRGPAGSPGIVGSREIPEPETFVGRTFGEGRTREQMEAEGATLQRNPFVRGVAGVGATMWQGALDLAAGYANIAGADAFAERLRNEGRALSSNIQREGSEFRDRGPGRMTIRGPAGSPRELASIPTPRTPGFFEEGAEMLGGSGTLMISPLFGPAGVSLPILHGVGTAAQRRDEEGLAPSFLTDFTGGLAGTAYGFIERLGGPQAVTALRASSRPLTQAIMTLGKHGAIEAFEETAQDVAIEGGVAAMGGAGAFEGFVEQQPENWKWAFLLGMGLTSPQVAGDYFTGVRRRHAEEAMRRIRMIDPESLSSALDKLLDLKANDPEAMEELSELARKVGAGEVDPAGNPTPDLAVDVVGPPVSPTMSDRSQTDHRTRGEQQAEQDETRRMAREALRARLRTTRERFGNTGQAETPEAVTEAPVAPEQVAEQPAPREPGSEQGLSPETLGVMRDHQRSLENLREAVEKAPFTEIHQQALDEKAASDQRVVAALLEDDPKIVQFATKGGVGTNSAVVVHQSVKEPGRWQATVFGSMGPNFDTQHETLEEALGYVLREYPVEGFGQALDDMASGFTSPPRINPPGGGVYREDFADFGEQVETAPEAPVPQPTAPEQVVDDALGGNRKPHPRAPEKATPFERAAAQATTRTAQGKEQDTSFPGSGEKIRTRYEVVDARLLVPSHDAETFEWRRDHIAGTQFREYTGDRGRQARESTVAKAANNDVDQSLDPTISADGGAPVVVRDPATGKLFTVAGNARTMLHQILHNQYPENSSELRQALTERAAEFGLDAEEVAQIEQPVLVRVSVDLTPDQVERIAELNRASDAPRGKTKDVLSDANTRATVLMGADTALSHFAETVDPELTIRAYLTTPAGRKFLKLLVEDAVIGREEQARFIDTATGFATDEGKQMVERMMYVAAIGDVDTVARAPAGILRKLDSALPAIIRANTLPGYELEDTLNAALNLLAQAAAQGSKLVTYLQQTGLFGDAFEDITVVRLAERLEQDNKRLLTDRFRSYTTAAAESFRANESDDLFGYEPPTDREIREKLLPPGEIEQSVITTGVAALRPDPNQFGLFGGEQVPVNDEAWVRRPKRDENQRNPIVSPDGRITIANRSISDDTKYRITDKQTGRSYWAFSDYTIKKIVDNIRAGRPMSQARTGAVALSVGQTNLFGELVEERYEQADAFGDKPGGVSQARSDAEATVSRLRGAVERGSATPAQVKAHDEANAVLRRLEGRGLDAKDVAQRVSDPTAKPDKISQDMFAGVDLTDTNPLRGKGKVFNDLDGGKSVSVEGEIWELGQVDQIGWEIRRPGKKYDLWDIYGEGTAPNLKEATRMVEDLAWQERNDSSRGGLNDTQRQIVANMTGELERLARLLESDPKLTPSSTDPDNEVSIESSYLNVRDTLGEYNIPMGQEGAEFDRAEERLYELMESRERGAVLDDAFHGGSAPRALAAAAAVEREFHLPKIFREGTYAAAARWGIDLDEVRAMLFEAKTAQELVDRINSIPQVAEDAAKSVQPRSGKDTWATYNLGIRTYNEETGFWDTDGIIRREMADPVRMAMHDALTDRLIANHGYFNPPKNPDLRFDGEVARERLLYIIMGPPAAGKSSVAEPMAASTRSLLVDSDEAKKGLEPEFMGGAGAGSVHQESSALSGQIYKAALAQGMNIVYPTVGSDLEGLLETIQEAKAQGYTVQLVINELPIHKAAWRALARHMTQMRYVSYEYIILHVDGNPARNWREIKENHSELVDGLWRYSNDVSFGQDPILLESAGANPDPRADIRRELPGLRTDRESSGEELAGGEGRSGVSEDDRSRVPARAGAESRPAGLIPLTSVLPGSATEVLEGTGEETPSAATAMETVQKVFREWLGVKTTVGKPEIKGAWATFNPAKRKVAVTGAKQYGALAHELGHALQAVIFPGTGGRNSFRITNEPLSALPLRLRAELYELGEGISTEELVEGFAEFWRRYVEAPAALQQVAPQSYEYFDKRLSEEAPEIREALLEFRESVALWNRSGARARFGASVRTMTRDPFWYRVHDRFQRFRSDIIDGYDAIPQLAKWLEETRLAGGSLIDVLKAQEAVQHIDDMLRLHQGAEGEAEHAIRFGLTSEGDPTKIVAPALEDVLKPVMKNRTEFTHYLVAMRALELNEQGRESGFSDADANQILKETEEAGLTELFERTATDLYAFKDALLQKLVDAGVMTQASADAIREYNQKHVPFYRISDNRAVTGTGGGRGFGRVRSPIRRLKGSEADIVDPLQSIVRDIYAFHNIIARQRVANAMFELAGEPGMAWAAEKIAKVVPNRYSIEETLDVMEKEAPDLVEFIREKMEDMADEGAEVDMDAMLAFFRPMDLTDRPNTISVLRDGKRKYLELDPDIYDSLTFMDEQRALDIPGWRLLNRLSRTLRAGATTALEFLFRNPVRDQFMAYVQSEYGYVPFVDLVKGITEISRTGPAYRAWLASGGANSSLYGLDMDSANAAVKKIMGEFDSEKLSPFHWLRVTSALLEEATRVAEFQNAIKRGASTKDAAIAAREISTDFARHGAKTGAIRGIATFWNARVQGYDRLYRAAKKNPAAFWAKVVTGIVIPTLIEQGLAWDDEEYWEIPQWRRDYFWNFKIGGAYVPIPKPFELGLVFGTGLARAMQAIGRHDEQTNAELKRFIMQTALTESQSLIPMPSGATPVLENIAGYSFFLDRQLVPESQTDLEPRLQRSPFSSDPAVLVGEFLNVSPRKVDNLIYGYGAGVARMVTDLTDPLLTTPAERNAGEEPDRGASRIPGIRAFVSPPAGFGSESVQEFYRTYDRAITAKRTATYYEELGDEAALDEYLTDERVELLEKESAFRKVAMDLASLRDEVDIVQRDPDLSGKEKREKIEELGRIALNLTREALGRAPLELNDDGD